MHPDAETSLKNHPEIVNQASGMCPKMHRRPRDSLNSRASCEFCTRIVFVPARNTNPRTRKTLQCPDCVLEHNPFLGQTHHNGTQIKKCSKRSTKGTASFFAGFHKDGSWSRSVSFESPVRFFGTVRNQGSPRVFNTTICLGRLAAKAAPGTSVGLFLRVSQLATALQGHRRVLGH